MSEKQVRVPIEKASIEQLREFCELVLNIEVSPKATRVAVLNKIRDAGWPGGEIPVFAEVKAERPPSGLMGAGDHESSKVEKGNRTFYRIIIPNEDKPGGEDPVQVGVNGRLMFVPRGEPVTVPEEYIEALSHAVQHFYDEYAEGKGGLGVPRKVLSYPFSYV